MYQCFHCLKNAVVWQTDYSFEDYDYPEEGIIHILVCSNCGAEITYEVPLNNEEGETNG